jgi:GGDEF domain-containing protein
MISLRKTATELDRLEELHRTAVNCYSQAFRSAEQNAIELDSAQAADFRRQLQALRNQLRLETEPREWNSIQTSFDSQLKDYGDKTRLQVQRLRQEVQAAAAAVESFAGSISESEINLESGLKRELQILNQSAASDNIQEIRGSIRTATAKIAEKIDEMRSCNQLAIAQLKDEIRLLHQEVQAARRSQIPSDPSSESHQRITAGMEELIHENKSFSVLLVVVRNLEGLQNCHSANAIADALRSFQGRFENILPAPAIVGRWANDQFAAILSTAPGNAIEMSSDVVRKLSEPFLETDQARAQSIVFTPRAGVVEFPLGSDLAKFQAKLKQLADALAR